MVTSGDEQCGIQQSVPSGEVSGGERHRAFVEQSAEGVWCFEVDPPVPSSWTPADQVAAFYERGRLVECNHAMARMYGFTDRAELLGARVSDFLPQDEAASVEYLTSFILSGYRLTNAESEERDRTGAPRAYLNNLVGVVESEALVRVWGTQRDITPLKLLEARLTEAQKLEALGMLSAGVAHDFNNVLGAIQVHCDLALTAPMPGDARADIDAIVGLVSRASEMTRQLLAFGRKQMLKPVVLAPNEELRKLEPILRRFLGGHATLTLALDPAAGEVRVDPNQIERTLINLVVNANDAMPEGGCVTLETEAVEVDVGRDARFPTAPPGRYVRLAVRDTGVGMDDDTLARVFEPFFTTKPRGKGTGLGLAVVHGIVTQSGGRIAVRSQRPGGTAVEILLPVVHAA